MNETAKLSKGAAAIKIMRLRKDKSLSVQPVGYGKTQGRDREFLPAALEILETPPSPMAVALVLTICTFMIGALVWAFLGSLDVYAIAPGKIGFNGSTKVIQPLDAGKVAQINVENGSHVNVGDLLLVFDPAEAAADEKSSSDTLLALRAEIARRHIAIDTAAAYLQQQRVSGTLGNLDSGIKWKAAEELGFPASLRLREEAVLSADLNQLSDTLSNLSKQMSQKDATRQRLNMSINFQVKLLQTLTERVAVREASIKLNVGTKINLFDAEEALQKSQSALASDQGQLIETEAALEELKSQRFKSLSQFIADNQSKLADAARKADETTQQLNKARAKLGRTRLTSPIEGTVQQLAITTIGQIVTTGQQLMMITPETGALEVETFINNTDIGFVRLGQEATVKIDAFPFTRFGSLHGTVTKIAADAIDEQEARRGQANVTSLSNSQNVNPSGGAGQPQSFVFPVTLSLNESEIKIGNVIVPIKPGMTATAEILTDRRRIIDYLLSPIGKVASEAMKER